MADSSSASLSPVIVTGGCGFVGFHLVSGLLASEPGCEIHVIDVNTSHNRVAGVTYYDCDITARAEVEAVFARARPRTVFSLASPKSTDQDDEAFRRICKGGVRNVLRAAMATETAQAFVYTSSSSIIHDNRTDLVDADESFPVLQYPAQKLIYSLSKAEAEAEVLASNRRAGDASLLTVSIRPVTVFGARDMMFMGTIIANARAGKGHIQMGPGHNIFSFTYVSNLVDAHILAARALVAAYGRPPPPQAMRVDGDSFIITNDEDRPFWEFQRAISASVGFKFRPEDITVIPTWACMIYATMSEWWTWIYTWGKGKSAFSRFNVRLATHHRTLKCDKAKRVLGYRPKVGLDEGLEIASKWFLAQPQAGKKTV
ncbi:hypothetical protein CDD83_5572 [Cordyceps sp. RAO-2017]|nr:hypothetical protein CDD83_5572 [Cordyceps sp. RAO-2017]